MRSFSSSIRTQNLEMLNNEPFDVLVIGGGVTGAGVALDAAMRGYTVALIEKVDFAAGTSSKSTKLVHGGIRYLPNFDFALVHEALVERGLLLQNAPFLVKPLGFVLPIYKGDRHPVGMPFTTPGGVGLGFLLDAGLWLYDLMAGRRSVKRHRRLRTRKVLDLAPALVTKNLKEGFIYYDAQTNDVRLTLTLIRTAAHYGATIVNHTEAVGFVLEDEMVHGVHYRDTISGQEGTIRARHIINATGVFSEEVEALSGQEPQVQVEPSKGVHLVLRREDLRLGDNAIVLPETEDKRILFVVPWGSRAIFGTTDTGVGELDRPTVEPDDVAYLLKYLNRYFSVNLREEDIVSTYAGYRPLLKPRKTHFTTAKLSRTHSVLQSPSGLITIVGGKLTTYRRMAQDTVDVLSQRDGAKPVHPTQALPLQGSAGWPGAQRELRQRARQMGLSMQTIDHLGSSYGTTASVILAMVAQDPELGQVLVADLPYIKAEVIYACRYEMALTLSDVLARRTSILLEDYQQGLGIATEVAMLMKKELGWTSRQEQAMVQTYQEEIEAQRPRRLHHPSAQVMHGGFSSSSN